MMLFMEVFSCILGSVLGVCVVVGKVKVYSVLVVNIVVSWWCSGLVREGRWFIRCFF